MPGAVGSVGAVKAFFAVKHLCRVEMQESPAQKCHQQRSQTGFTGRPFWGDEPVGRRGRDTTAF
ncbi:hypothetical protein SAMN05444424_1912 [Bittarella massiliensis (ex Durand et al. 2017)]|uniref:Uncharacterized protein n=1 Tax=Bittarella massiliensis (ex Durand et al. 2017) TaxID=1720313 RepID=A0AAQ1RWE7_9FIRM|nr:hypothetical protein SAMN05444424_1912 [Bittarella massiliensis (ex Durand et al. 2017)]